VHAGCHAALGNAADLVSRRCLQCWQDAERVRDLAAAPWRRLRPFGALPDSMRGRGPRRPPASHVGWTYPVGGSRSQARAAQRYWALNASRVSDRAGGPPRCRLAPGSRGACTSRRIATVRHAALLSPAANRTLWTLDPRPPCSSRVVRHVVSRFGHRRRCSRRRTGAIGPSGCTVGGVHWSREGTGRQQIL